MTLTKLTVRALAGVALSLLAFPPNNLVRLTPVAFAQDGSSACAPVGGVLMTNIGVIAGVTNLGPVSGDLAGSVAATILGQNSNGTFNVQHYWVTAAGETITLKVAVLKPTYPTSDTGIVAVSMGKLQVLHHRWDRQIEPCHGLSGLLWDRGFSSGHAGPALRGHGLPRALRERRLPCKPDQHQKKIEEPPRWRMGQNAKCRAFQIETATGTFLRKPANSPHPIRYT